ncbi:beta-lactamase class A [Selenomonas sp. GACV-9]|uniref:serine hydrolase n=1 Tax=Selenomonas sp. GACV-9 TaxID=3158782 RepID=UPI0008F0ED08|nr:beta-lactamase class A [Selenomonas ruminantium]
MRRKGLACLLGIALLAGALLGMPVERGWVEAKGANDSLAQVVESLSNSDSTRYALFVCYPAQDREVYSYHSAPMRSASMIKVFILGTAMEKIRDGQLDLYQNLTLHGYDKVGGAGVLAGYANGTELSLDKVMRLMITESDNTATNMLIDLLGMASINEYMQRNGYTDTILQRKMMDSQAMAAGRENYTSVNDLGNFFVKLYHRSCVSPQLDDVMLGYLEGQTDTECFPAALPGIMICHKTGELYGLYDDGGIVYQEGNPFIIVGMTDNYSSRGRAISILRQMAQAAANN